jgi:hypothetical protein
VEKTLEEHAAWFLTRSWSECRRPHAGCWVLQLQLMRVQMAPGLSPDPRLQMVRALQGPRMLRDLHLQTLTCSWFSAAGLRGSGSMLAAGSSLPLA